MIKKIVLIGAGNVATHLGSALCGAGCDVVQVYSRTKESAMELADKSGNSNRAIMFNGGDRIEDILLKKNYSKENCRDAEINIDALYTLEINEYKDYRNVQLNIKDFREI